MKLLIIIGILILVFSLVYFVLMIKKNWDVLVVDSKRLTAESAAWICMLLVLIVAYGGVYLSGNTDIWTVTALTAAAVTVLCEGAMIFRKVRMIKDQCMELLETLICVMEAGDPNLDGHSLHVHNLVGVFYDYLPTGYQQKLNYENLKYASLFLDMGKLGIPRSILTKKGKLTKEEMELMRRHPEICVKIVEPVSSFSMISDWILYHHERVDGKGYHGLKGSEIPLAARMITIADTYSAMTMDRTYKASMNYEDAVIELRQAAGTQLDEELVGYFLEIPRHRLDECMVSVRAIMGRYHDEHFGD